MALGNWRVRLMREKHPQGHHRVTFVELFFDLVFVFAITQISHTMLAHFTPLGVLQTILLMLAVWWVWIYTSWLTNWLDPEQIPVRLMLFMLMVAGLVMSTSIPKAFETRGLAFAIALVFMQVGRTALMLWFLSAGSSPLRHTFRGILIWFLLSGVFWISGALAAGDLRLFLWVVALVIEYLGPSMRYWLPRLGAVSVSDWNIDGGHMAERCGLFIIIALGESILVTGATFADTQWTAATMGAFVSAFLASLAMWWIYFHKGADAGSALISHSDNPGRVARLAYTYLHMPIVAGIIVTAVGDELVLGHPDGQADLKVVIGLIGGPLLFLIGVILFKRAIHGRLQLSHLGGIGMFLLLMPPAQMFSPLGLSAATTLVLVVVAIWEAVSLRARDTPIPRPAPAHVPPSRSA